MQCSKLWGRPLHVQSFGAIDTETLWPLAENCKCCVFTHLSCLMDAGLLCMSVRCQGWHQCNMRHSRAGARSLTKQGNLHVSWDRNTRSRWCASLPLGILQVHCLTAKMQNQTLPVKSRAVMLRHMHVAGNVLQKTVNQNVMISRRRSCWMPCMSVYPHALLWCSLLPDFHHAQRCCLSLHHNQIHTQSSQLAITSAAVLIICRWAAACH